MVAKRGLTNGANVHTPYVKKKSLKTQHGIIPIDPAFFAAIGHRFIGKKTLNDSCDLFSTLTIHTNKSECIFSIL